jgi:hypothetical protein
MNNYEIELEEDDKEIISKKDSIVSKLKDFDLLRYGVVITEDDVEKVMSVKKEDTNETNWQFLKLQLREIVKTQGFYITSRGRENNLYILLPHEMPTHNERKAKSEYRALKMRNRALHMIDSSILSKDHQKKLEFEIFRNASLEIEMSQSIKKRCR